MLVGPLVQSLANFLQLFPSTRINDDPCPTTVQLFFIDKFLYLPALRCHNRYPKHRRKGPGGYTASERTRRARRQKSERGDFLAPDAPQGAQPRVRTEIHRRAR